MKSRRAQNPDDFETWIEGGVAPTLNQFDNGDVRAVVAIVEEIVFQPVPIQDGREIVKMQNGLGVGAEGDPSYTLDRTGAQSVAFDGYNQTVSDVSQTIRADKSDGDHVGMVMSSVVRRLTPVECERLQGFPDNWTAGQADSHRYKQMGNAVTVNVAAWVGQMIMEAENAEAFDSTNT